MLNIPESPQLTSETPHAFAPSDNNVSQTKSYVKCAVVIDGHGRQNNKIIDSNAITSVHTRQNAIAGLLKDAVNDEAAGNTSVYYIDAKKATGLLQRVGLQLPKRLFRTDGYVHSIRNSDSNVKPKIENVTKATALLFSVNCMTKTIILL